MVVGAPRVAIAGSRPNVAEIHNTQQLLNRIGRIEGDKGRISLEAVLDEIGHRSFGPLILFAGLVSLSPIGDIPGATTLVALFVLLIASQLVIGWRYFWLPRWLLHRTASKDKIKKATAWLQRPARAVDRVVQPRLRRFAEGTAQRLIAVTCAAIALVMPIMEVVPFSATGAGAALTAFGLAVVARDGLVAILGFAATLANASAVVYRFLTT
jgi:hypothetical protein